MCLSFIHAESKFSEMLEEADKSIISSERKGIRETRIHTLTKENVLFWIQ